MTSMTDGTRALTLLKRWLRFYCDLDAAIAMHDFTGRPPSPKAFVRGQKHLFKKTKEMLKKVGSKT